MVRRESNIKSEVRLEIENTSLLNQLDGVISFDSEIGMDDNSREILLFRYPVKKPSGI